MNKHKPLATIISIAVLSFPLVSFAQASPSVQAQIDALLKQIAELQAQIATLQGNSSNSAGPAEDPAPWVSLTYTLTLGSRDATTNGEVSKLQQFLKSEGVYPEGSVTGYFGPATSRAVQKWQASRGITITTPGIGIVGPKTRAAMVAKFKGYTKNKGPVISSLSGPTSLAVNESGTWTVKATDPENDSLKYVVRWGDEPSPGDVTYPFNWPALGFATAYNSPTFTHSYSIAGTYTMQVAVTDANKDVNHVTDRTLTVIVR